MKNKMFSGWKDVLLFTLKQGFTQRYKMITLILAVILFAAGFAFNIIAALGQDEDDSISAIETVYVMDDSGIDGLDWEDSQNIDREVFPDLVFKPTSEDLQKLGLRLQENEVTSVIAKITKTQKEYLIRVYLPNNTFITKDEGDKLAKSMRDRIHQGLIGQAGIDSDKLVYVVGDMNIEFATVGENAKSDAQRILVSIFPMIFMFFIYFMVVIYGQSMGQIVCMEKSSKLMETLLVMTRPYGLIFGKIIATACSAILQIGLWIVAGVGGFVVGDSYARSSIYEGYDNAILNLFREIAKDEYTRAFASDAIALTVIALCLAFLFYCMLAGAIASFASKAEELGSVMMFYNLFLVLGFVGSYIIPMMTGAEWIKVLIRLIPMSSAFLLPGEILVGTVSVKAGLVYVLILGLWTVITAVFAGKIYKDQVFYNGKSLKDRIPWLKKQIAETEEGTWQYLHDEAGRPVEKTQKIGYFFLAISPLAIFLVIQLFASLVLTNIMSRVDLKGIDLATWEVKDFVNYYSGIEDVLNPLTMMVSHLLIILTFGIWMYFVRRFSEDKNIIHVKSLMGKKLPFMVGSCLLYGVCLCFFANGVAVLEAELIPSVVENYFELAKASGMGQSVFAIIATVCLAPIGEELLCRGVCLHFARKAFGKFWYANILQALLFGILHMNWVQGVYAFFIGLVLGMLVEKYDSLLPGMLVHFVVNLSSSTWVPKVIENVELTLVAGILLVAIPAVIILALMRLEKRI